MYSSLLSIIISNVVWILSGPYRNSGRMTADAVKASSSTFGANVDLDDSCYVEVCLSKIDLDQYAYHVMPDILRREGRAADWSGKLDRIEIRPEIYDVMARMQLADWSSE